MFSVSIRRARLRRTRHLPTVQGRIRDSSGPNVKVVIDCPDLDACAGGGLGRHLSGAVSRTPTKHLHRRKHWYSADDPGVVRSATLKSGNPSSQLGSPGDDELALCYL